MLLVILLLIGAAIYFLIRPLERRISSLSAATERFGQGDLGSRAQVDSQDAIADLAKTFNAMADRIELLIDRQKELLRAVSHELRTPLARLFFLVDNARQDDTVEGKNRHLKRIEGALTDLNDIVEELLTFVRLDGEAVQLARETVDVPAVLRDVVEQVPALRGDVAVEVDCRQVEVSAVSRYFKSAVLNLVANAVHYARSRVRIACWCEGGTLCLSVDDDGPGIPEEVRKKVFEPFFRLDESRSADRGGVGLGLAIVQRIMALHNGSVRVSDSLLGGARFMLVFPLEAQTAGPVRLPEPGFR